MRDDAEVTGTASRLLELLALLQARRDWPGPELARRLGVSERTVRRDVDRLRRLGYPVGSLTGPAGRYRLAPGTAMPPLLLDEDEAVAIAVGLRSAAWSAVEGIEETSLRALVKLEQVLPAHLRERVRDVGATAMASPTGGPTVDAQHLALLGAARRDGERVRFSYRRRDGETARREVEPHALVAIGRRWYLVGWDVRREDWRTFRIDRIADPVAAAVRFAPREVPGGDPVAFVAAGRRAGISRHEAHLTVGAPAEAVRRRLPGGWGEVTPIDDERCAVRMGDDDLAWLAHRVALLGADVEVHEPPELRGHLAEMGRRLLRAGGGARLTPAAPVAAAAPCVAAGHPTRHNGPMATGPSPDLGLGLDDQLCFAVYAASRAITARYRPLLGELGLTYPQYLVMLVLWEGSPQSVGSLGDRLQLDSGTLSPLVKRLESLGLVTRRRRADDERSVAVALTDEGLRLREQATCIPGRIAGATEMGAADLEELRDALRTLADRLRGGNDRA